METIKTHEKGLKEEQRERGKEALRSYEEKAKKGNFFVNPDNYKIFSKQIGTRKDERTGETKEMTLGIDETLGLMVGSVAETIATLSGEARGKPKADYVIYLDKSARPVSWLVDEFWNDFSDQPRPEESFLAIDREPWFERVGVKLGKNQEIELPNGERRAAKGSDFWDAWEKMPKERQREYLSRIRALYIEGGIEDTDVDKIMSTPTVLDGKNVTIIDEVERSGSTLSIAAGLIQRAFNLKPEKVTTHVFWKDIFKKVSGETQMGSAPVWYPRDNADWRGRGIKDINPEYFRRRYEENPNNKTRAEYYGAFVLGEPLLNREDEPGQLSWKLREEIERMEEDYRNGNIVPTIPAFIGRVEDRMVEHLEQFGVEFTALDDADKNPKAYWRLVKSRDEKRPAF